MPETRKLRCRAAFVFTLLTAGATAQKTSDYDAALARYQECIQRLSFGYQTEGRERLARTRKPEALQLLVADYQKTKAWTEYARYTLAALFMRHFDTADAVEVLDALRQKHDQPVDTWLWVAALKVKSNLVGDAEAFTVATAGKTAAQRAAAVVALGRASRVNLGRTLSAVCAGFPKKDHEADRNVLLGAMSGAIYENRGRLQDEDFRAGVAAYIRLLDPAVGLTHTAKVQVARHLQWTLNGQAPWENPEPWLELLARGDVKAAATASKAHTVTQQRFFGIETDGERLCYVIDMSDSMLKTISPTVKPQATVTGPRKKKPKGELLDESDLPWDKIQTRFDLAREQLRISLSRLPTDKYFAVVWFGDKSGTLNACKGMIKASKGNVAKVMEELDGIEKGPAQPGKSPEGTLKGATNLHSGLRTAFGLTHDGLVDENAYVDPHALTEGCDTIFLLSDGAPSIDDFEIKDRDYGEGKVVIDREQKTETARPPVITYYGPYDDNDWIVEDVGRMNAFRRIVIHCVGVGEANMNLLGRLAEITHGQTFEVGRDKGGKNDKGGAGNK